MVCVCVFFRKRAWHETRRSRRVYTESISSGENGFNGGRSGRAERRELRQIEADLCVKRKVKQGHSNSGNGNGIYFPVDVFCLDSPFHRAGKQHEEHLWCPKARNLTGSQVLHDKTVPFHYKLKQRTLLIDQISVIG